MKEAFYKNNEKGLIEISAISAFKDVNNYKTKEKNCFICKSCKKSITITHMTNAKSGFITPYFAARGTQSHTEDCKVGITSKNVFNNNYSNAIVNFGKLNKHNITYVEDFPPKNDDTVTIKSPKSKKGKNPNSMSSRTFFNHAEHNYNTVITKIQKSNFIVNDYNNGETIAIQNYFVYPNGKHLKYLKTREFRVFNGLVDYVKYSKNNVNYIRVTFELSKSKYGNEETYFNIRENASFKNIYEELDFNLENTKRRYINDPLRTGCFIRGKLNFNKKEGKYNITEPTNIWICDLTK